MTRLPSQLNMIVHIESDGGFWVEFPTLSGCYTQGDSLAQLQNQVFDALLTYFDIPREQAKELCTDFEFEGKGTIRTQQLQPAGA